VRRVFSSFDLLAAHHAKNLLQAQGLHAEVRNERLASAMGELPPAECLAEVWVGEDEAAAAERLLREGVPASGPAWTCARCGERLEPQFAQCWRCGASRPPAA
jgi:Putative prokaryotic signal transducing protein